MTLHAGTSASAELGGGHDRPRPARDLAPIGLVDLLDRLLGAGVVVAGDVVVSLAGVDLVEIRLQLLISSVRPEMAESRKGSGG
ncbi:MAG: gas vesicle protein GvpJ [Intrasporangium sp.]|uniref:gas vesicle protein GvpJ n=1 Tax=Intrasporangium sp. TaxID=1925024 RepID=UPI003F7D36F3